MSDAVEGEWKTFEIKLATNKDVAEISKHVREFFLRDEPLNTLSEWTEENALAHDKMVELVITHGLSLVIREKATGEVNKRKNALCQTLRSFTLFSKRLQASIS